MLERLQIIIALLILAISVSFALPAKAVLPDEMLKDPVLEKRARALSKVLRCVVCQNQSIDDSGAPIARDLRVIVRERLTKGETDKQALDYIVARYGNFVLLTPPMQANTVLLWFGPGIIFLVALTGFGFWLRQRGQSLDVVPVALSKQEQSKIDAIIRGEIER